MQITTVIPMYNSKDTIKSTIESVLNQTYKEPIEIIVINDGSKDGCEKIVEEIILNNRTNRTVKLINKENGGASSARNIGIKNASGEYIAFLDSDDIWHPCKLEIISKILNQNDIDVLGHAYTLNNNFNENFDVQPIKKISFFSLLIKNFAVTPSVIVKREKCLLFNEKMRYTEDHDLWLRMALKNKVYFVDIPLVQLGRPQLSQGGLSSNRWAMRKGEMQMYINITREKKSLVLLLPLLLTFSLLKHFRKYIKNSFAKSYKNV